MMVVDRLTKYRHLVAMSHPITTSILAQEFIEHVYELHGLPKSIVSDGDKIFTNNFWQSLFKSLGVMLKLSSTYHKHTDGKQR